MLDRHAVRFRSGVRRLALMGAMLVCALGAIAPRCHAARNVVIVSIDGLRPDVALRADMPAFRSLMARGSFTMFAITTDMAVTIPSHVSMLTGVPPSKHGIVFNTDPDSSKPVSPAWPTLFQLAQRAGLSTAMSAGKSKFSLFASDAVLDRVSIPPRGGSMSDSLAGLVAAKWIATRQPRVLFLHFAGPDLAGHEWGWGSPEQIAAVSAADRALGRVLEAVAKRAATDSTLIIVSADHGGSGLTHGGTDARSRFIPWIAAGPGVRRGYDLTRETTLEVRTEDTFATACAWLGLPIDKPVDGAPVTAIFASAAARR